MGDIVKPVNSKTLLIDQNLNDVEKDILEYSDLSLKQYR